MNRNHYIGVLYSRQDEGGCAQRQAPHGPLGSGGTHGLVSGGFRLDCSTSGAHRTNEEGFFVSEECSRIPMLIRYPGVKNHNENHYVSTVDITPTILTATGVEPRLRQHGRDLTRLIKKRRASIFSGGRRFTLTPSRRLRIRDETILR
jgi:hypothetical protein